MPAPRVPRPRRPALAPRADTTAPTAPPTGAPRRHPAAVVALCAVVLALSGPGQTAGVSVLVDHFIADLDVSRSAVSTAYLVGTLSGAVLLPWLGRAVDRFGTRPVLALVAVAFGAFLTLLSVAEELVGLTAAFVGVRAMGQGGMTLVSTTAVAVAVTRGRGTAVGVTTAVGTAGISLVPLLAERAVAEFGWRWTVFAEAVLIWAVALPIAAWGLRGVRRAGDGETGRTAHGGPAQDTWPLRAVVRTSMFWVVTSAVACSGLVSTAVYFHQVALLGEQGLSAAQAAANFLPQTVAGLAASFLFGAAADRYSPKLLVFGAMALQTGALAMLPLVSPGVTALLYGVTLGAAASGARAVEAAAFPHYYGTGVLGTLRGLTQSVAVASTAVAPLLLSLGRDLAGSYVPAVLALAALPALIALAAPFARVPRAAAD